MPHILRRPWWPIAAGVCLGVLVAVVGVKLTIPQVFEAQAAVAFNPDELPPDLLRHFVDGHTELDHQRLRKALLSDALLHEVIVRAYPISASPEAEQRLADGIRERLSLWFRRQGQMIEVRYYDRSPVRAAEVVNLFARFFGEEDIVYAAAPSSAAQVAPSLTDYLALGVVGGLLGGLLVLLGRLGRVAVERFARGH